MKRIGVEVSQHYINRGVRCHPMGCPVALALTAVFGPGTSVGRYEASVGRTPETSYRVDLPAEVTLWTEAFDSKLPVQPFNFFIEVPDDLWVATETIPQ